MNAAQSSRLSSWLADGVDFLFVHPPFAGIDRPSYALHLMQAIAREEGWQAKVLYGNLALAKEVGESLYESICYASSGALLGERFFAEAAYGVPPHFRQGHQTPTHIRTSKIEGDLSSVESIYALAIGAPAWCSIFAGAIVASGCTVVGFTTTFEQTAAAVAIARRIRALDPDITIIIGGANCEGEMAEGLASLNAPFDYIFSGESESTFRDWCRIRRHSATTATRGSVVIVRGQPCMDLDSLPAVDYADYYFQLAIVLPESDLVRAGAVWLPYETSRGCWWGEVHHCTFCGINGEGMKFREKTALNVIADLNRLMAEHPNKQVLMLDNIMPHTYFASLLPALARQGDSYHIFYEQKANLDFRRMALLKAAGVLVIQPGIEALNSDLLNHMRKGVTARQNIALLRFAKMQGVFVNWNLLHSFPGDQLEWYERTLALLPALTHLCPPTGVFGLSIDRFSPYFDRSAEFGLSAITAVPSYLDVLPKYAAIQKIAYHFEAHYESESRADSHVIGNLEDAVSRWRRAWEASEPPQCAVVKVDETCFLLIDTRPEIGGDFEFIDRARAEIALVGRRSNDQTGDSELRAWALARQVCAELDGSLVPLAVSTSDLYLELDPTASEKLRVFEMRELKMPVALRFAQATCVSSQVETARN